MYFVTGFIIALVSFVIATYVIHKHCKSFFFHTEESAAALKKQKPYNPKPEVGSTIDGQEYLLITMYGVCLANIVAWPLIFGIAGVIACFAAIYFFFYFIYKAVVKFATK
jgi:hypothetical protein